MSSECKHNKPICTCGKNLHKELKQLKERLDQEQRLLECKEFLINFLEMKCKELKRQLECNRDEM